MDNKQLKIIVELIGQKVVKDVQSALRAKQSTGRLYNSVRYQVKKELDRFVLYIYYKDYGKYVDEGRRPGKFPPVKSIKKWTKTKGIKEELAFAIAYSIYKFGIEPIRFSDYINRGFNDYTKISEAFRADITEESLKIIEEIKQKYK